MPGKSMYENIDNNLSKKLDFLMFKKKLHSSLRYRCREADNPNQLFVAAAPNKFVPISKRNKKIIDLLQNLGPATATRISYYLSLSPKTVEVELNYLETLGYTKKLEG